MQHAGQLVFVATLLLGLISCTDSDRGQGKGAAGERAQSLFNGRDLTGWAGDSRIWSVEEGAVTGRTSDSARIQENSYLVWQGGEIEDFELVLKYRLRNGNSGIYCRARHREPGEKRADPVFAWQADIDEKHEWTGVIMEWTGRERLANRGEKVVIDERGQRIVVASLGDPAGLASKVKANDWNEYAITARGGHIVLKINDVIMSELQDNDPQRAKRGLLALQVHTGAPMQVQFKDIVLRKL